MRGVYCMDGIIIPNKKLFKMATRIKFKNNPRIIMDTLQERVDDFFKGKKRTGDYRLHLKATLIIISAIAIYCTLLLVEMPAWIAIPLLIVFGTIVAFIGFNIMHDAVHGSFSEKKWVNELMGYSLNILGGNKYFWKWKHNGAHHTFTNIEHHDEDIDIKPFLRINPEQPKYWFHRFQAYYAIFLYGLSYLLWIYFQDFKKYFTQKVSIRKIDIPLKEHIIFWVSKMVHIGIFIGIPLFFHSLERVLIAYGILVFSCGIVIAIIFQLAHVVEQTEMIPEPTNTGTVYILEENALHQLRTTADFAPRNTFLSWCVGGLNYQVEHHLFPKISHVHYPDIRKIVIDVCDKLDLPHHEYDSFWQSIASHFRQLNKLGNAVE